MIAGIDERYTENVALTRRFSQTANMFTKDENLVDVTISVQYRIKNLKDFVLNVNDPEASLRQATESALRHVVGDNSLEETLTTGRQTLALNVQDRLQNYLDLKQLKDVLHVSDKIEETEGKAQSYEELLVKSKKAYMKQNDITIRFSAIKKYHKDRIKM